MDLSKKQFDFMFVPANTTSHLGQLAKKEFSKEKNQKIKEQIDEDLGWWQDNAIVPHNSLLVAYKYGKGTNIRDKYGIPEEHLLIGDSGGYEILTGVSKEMGEVVEMKNNGNFQKIQDKYGTTDIDEVEDIVAKKHEDDINYTELMDWFQGNVDIGMVLDFPPVQFAEGSKSQFKTVSDEEFIRRARFTGDNAKKMAEYIPKEERDFELYNILHAKIDDIRKMEDWYQEVKDADTDGWATTSKVVANPMFTAYALAFLHNKGVRRNVHLLGVAGFNSLPVIAYMSNYMDNITTDSFSYGMMGLRFRKTKTPNPLNTYSAIGLPDFSFGKTRDNELDEMPCNCKACKQVNDLGGTEILDQEGSLPGMFIMLHNMAQYKRYCEMLEKLKEDKELLLKFVRRNCDERTEKAIEFIDYAMEKNINVAYSRFSGEFSNTKSKGSGTAQSLSTIGEKSSVSSDDSDDESENQKEEEKSWDW